MKWPSGSFKALWHFKVHLSQFGLPAWIQRLQMLLGVPGWMEMAFRVWRTKLAYQPSSGFGKKYRSATSYLSNATRSRWWDTLALEYLLVLDICTQLTQTEPLKLLKEIIKIQCKLMGRGLGLLSCLLRFALKHRSWRSILLLASYLHINRARVGLTFIYPSFWRLLYSSSLPISSYLNLTISTLL